MYTYCSEKVFCINQVIIGRFWRSLKVGRITEYVSLPPVFLAILKKVLEEIEKYARERSVENLSKRHL